MTDPTASDQRTSSPDHSPFVVGESLKGHQPRAIRWRIIPCLFLGMYGAGAIGYAAIWTSIILYKHSKGQSIRVFHRMDSWFLAMMLAFACGSGLLLTCRHLWCGEWRRSGVMFLCSIVLGLIFFAMTGGVREPR